MYNALYSEFHGVTSRHPALCLRVSYFSLSRRVNISKIVIVSVHSIAENSTKQAVCVKTTHFVPLTDTLLNPSASINCVQSNNFAGQNSFLNCRSYCDVISNQAISWM